MKIILNEDVYNLGEEGDVCDVANGYARNYLLPQELAVPFNKQNLAVFEHRKEAIEKRKEEKRKAAQGLKDRLENLKLTVKMPAGETGKLFGSVNNAVIADALEKEGIAVERKKIDVPTSSIKMIGIYSILIKLYSGDTARIEVEVASTDGKAEAALLRKQEEAAAKGRRPSKEEKESDTAGETVETEEIEETVSEADVDESEEEDYTEEAPEDEDADEEETEE